MASEKAASLAQRYLYLYKHTPEFANWDEVVELGKALSDEVLGEASPSREKEKRTLPVEYKLDNDEKHLIQGKAYLQAIKAVRERLHLGLKEAKDLCDAYRQEGGY